MANTDQHIRSTELASQLRFAVMRLSRRLRQHAPEDITPSQLSALSVIVRDDRLTLSQLAEAERVQPPTITRVVDMLEQKGLAIRVPSEHDRRVAFVEPTPAGRALVETIRRRRDAYLARRLRTFSAEERELLDRCRHPARTTDRGSPNHDAGPPPRSRDTFSSLKNRNYRLYFIGQIISVSGTWMQRLAQAWLILRLTHNNGFALGVESGLQFLPVLLFGAWGGVIADRYDKRKLLYLTQIVAGLLALGLGLIVAAGAATVFLDYLFSVLLGFVNVVDNPARQTFVMEMVGRDELPNAVGLNSVVMNSSRVVGPAVGGIVIEAVGLAPCFFFNAASYLAVLLALWMMNADAAAAGRDRAAGQGPAARGLPLRLVGSHAAHAAGHDGGRSARSRSTSRWSSRLISTKIFGLGAGGVRRAHLGDGRGRGARRSRRRVAARSLVPPAARAHLRDGRLDPGRGGGADAVDRGGRAVRHGCARRSRSSRPRTPHCN